MRIKKLIQRTLFTLVFRIPQLKASYSLCRFLGIEIKGCEPGYIRISNPSVVGDCSFLHMGTNSEINKGCFLLLRNDLFIGKNSTIAYGASILTGANPHASHNKLGKIYPKMTAPVVIGDNCWIGANATILPGITIGDCSIVAAGAIVTKDVPPGVLVAGNPAVIKKRLDLNLAK